MKKSQPFRCVSLFFCFGMLSSANVMAVLKCETSYSFFKRVSVTFQSDRQSGKINYKFNWGKKGYENTIKESVYNLDLKCNLKKDGHLICNPLSKSFEVEVDGTEKQARFFKTKDIYKIPGLDIEYKYDPSVGSVKAEVVRTERDLVASLTCEEK